MVYNEKLDMFIAEVNMPMHIKAFITTRNGYTYITVNANLSDEAKMKALIHEVNHYRNNDNESDMPVAFLEK